MNKIKLLSITALIISLIACGSAEKDQANTTIIVPNPTPTATPAPTPKADPVQQNIDKIIAASGEDAASAEAIIAAAKKYDVDLANLKLNGNLIRMLVATNTSLTQQAEDIANAIKSNNNDTAVLLIKYYKVDVRTILVDLFPDIDIEQSTVSVNNPTDLPSGFAAIVTEIFKAISYQVTVPSEIDNQCYGFYRIGATLLSTTGGYPDFVKCEDIFVDTLLMQATTITSPVKPTLTPDKNYPVVPPALLAGAIVK